MAQQAQMQTARDIAGWRDIIGAAFGALDISAREDRPFHGRFRYRPLGGLIIAEINSANEDAQRTRHHIAHDSEEAFAFAFTRRGSMRVAQFGRSLDVPADCFTLLDLNSPYRLLHAEETDLVTLKAPADLLRMRIPDPRRHVLEVYQATTGVARISKDLLLSLAAQSSDVPHHLADAYAARVTDMFAMLIDAGSGASRGLSCVREQTLQRCKAIIEARLPDRELDPSRVAETAGLSVRYLHRIFSEAGLSVSDFIRERRLDRCRRELCDPARAGASIKQIAASCGFASAAHFSNAFRARFLETPRAARAGALQAARKQD